MVIFEPAVVFRSIEQDFRNGFGLLHYLTVCPCRFGADYGAHALSQCTACTLHVCMHGPNAATENGTVGAILLTYGLLP